MSNPMWVDELNALKLAYKALFAAEESFLARDKMNAHIHLGQVRSSPITDLLTTARQKLGQVLKERHGVQKEYIFELERSIHEG